MPSPVNEIDCEIGRVIFPKNFEIPFKTVVLSVLFGVRGSESVILLG